MVERTSPISPRLPGARGRRRSRPETWNGCYVAFESLQGSTEGTVSHSMNTFRNLYAWNSVDFCCNRNWRKLDLIQSGRRLKL